MNRRLCGLAALTAVSLGVVVIDHGPRADNIVPAQCQEDDPCWNPATMGNHEGFICFVWPNGEIHAYYDTTDAVGSRTDCPTLTTGGPTFRPGN